MSENEFTIKDLLYSVGMLAKRLEHGCGNHGCRIKPPKGMGTNAGCRCTPEVISTELLHLAGRVEGMGRVWPNKGAR